MTNNNNDNAKLRHVFVSMLFALVIGQLATTSYEVFKDFSANASYFKSVSDSFLHLLLTLFVITTSWVGWSSTFESENYPKLTRLWSPGYALLLIDIVILILYFSLVKSVDGIGEVTHSAVPEAIIIMLIFTLYVIWDVVHSSAVHSDTSWKIRGIELLPSLLCTLFCYFIWNALAKDGYNATADIALIAVVLSFRKLKAWQVMGLDKWKESIV